MGQGMVDRLAQVPLILVPAGRAPVQDGFFAGVEGGAQDLGKEAMVAVPLVLVVEGDEEQVGPLQLFQDGLAVLGCCWPGRVWFPGIPKAEGVAEGGAEPVEDGGLLQKAADRLWLALEHLGHQIVGHVAVIAGEGGDKCLGVAVRFRWSLALQRKGCQLEAGDPALGPGFEGGHGFFWKLQTHRLVEKGGRLLGCEAQVPLADLGDLAAGPEQVQRERRVLARAEDGVHGRRLVFEQELDGLVDGRCGDELVIVQHEEERGGGGGDVVDQGRDQALEGGGARRGNAG